MESAADNEGLLANSEEGIDWPTGAMADCDGVACWHTSLPNVFVILSLRI
jgi:hypothetical protein